MDFDNYFYSEEGDGSKFSLDVPILVDNKI